MFIIYPYFNHYRYLQSEFQEMTKVLGADPSSVCLTSDPGSGGHDLNIISWWENLKRTRSGPNLTQDNYLDLLARYEDLSKLYSMI